MLPTCYTDCRPLEATQGRSGSDGDGKRNTSSAEEYDFEAEFGAEELAERARRRENDLNKLVESLGFDPGTRTALLFWLSLLP